jgi:hypothetical protein
MGFVENKKRPQFGSLRICGRWVHLAAGRYDVQFHAPPAGTALKHNAMCGAAGWVSSWQQALADWTLSLAAYGNYITNGRLLQ